MHPFEFRSFCLALGFCWPRFGGVGDGTTSVWRVDSLDYPFGNTEPCLVAQRTKKAAEHRAMSARTRKHLQFAPLHWNRARPLTFASATAASSLSTMKSEGLSGPLKQKELVPNLCHTRSPLTCAGRCRRPRQSHVLTERVAC